ncbi:RNA polymerase sigma factor [Oceanobacillus picturae]|uniref:RNA polymerase sigma factor n=1 Tax=Oceanobacillus picturae TaxID=171693 RepID=A0A0U9HE77_9BACI|nr:sigma-70 family RNA polymerase sigma factor [Oceanobacillus picturae]GAQ19569.1 RNA polymerase sigma factor [Oceanobacillus picturae]
MSKPYTFEDIYEQNKRRIHYHIHKLNLQDPHKEYYQEGLIAMWQAYQKYNPDKGPMATYFNYSIRHKLIDMLRKQTNDSHKLKNYLEKQAPLLAKTTAPITYNEIPQLLNEIKSILTEKQWKWFYHAILMEMPLKEIAEQENVNVEAVKSWAKQARRKLRSTHDFLLM